MIDEATRGENALSDSGPLKPATAEVTTAKVTTVEGHYGKGHYSERLGI